jgi:glycine dehydrogenase subunit 1
MRYLPLTQDDRCAMLAKIGVASVDGLFRDVPPSARAARFALANHLGEIEVERMLSAFASQNVAAGSRPFFCGAGAYRHHVPASVDHLIQRSEFLTSYTPYQPEIAQGTLQVLFEFQTQVAMLTGMEVIVTGPVTPGQDENLAALIDGNTSCVVVQNPDVFGMVRDLKPIAAAAHAKGALLIAVFSEAVSLGLVEPPGAMGADIVTGEGQSFGNGLNFGGPYVGLFAAREKFLRQMPGRLAGETVDADGRRGYVLTLSAREQHIRREKATSNICTNSGLCALAFSIHLSLLGEAGLMRLAKINHAKAIALAERLTKVGGVTLVTPAFFNEFTLALPKSAVETVDALLDRGVVAGIRATRLYPHEPGLTNQLIVAATELTTDEDIAAYGRALEEVLSC